MHSLIELLGDTIGGVFRRQLKIAVVVPQIVPFDGRVRTPSALFGQSPGLNIRQLCDFAPIGGVF
jgi:hypothetical protein